MKKLRILIILFFIVSGVSAQDEKNAVLELLEEQRNAWNKGDLTGYMKGYLQSDSLLFVGRNGPTYGWNKTLDNYRKNYPDKEGMGILRFDIKEIKLIGSDHAFILGGWLIKWEKDTGSGFFTLLLKKVSGEWKIIADHSS